MLHCIDPGDSIPDLRTHIRELETMAVGCVDQFHLGAAAVEGPCCFGGGLWVEYCFGHLGRGEVR